jgi:NAD(P)-dependent dehydrogenase (short-subunit alcohol dehydrogenase family)
MAKVALVLGATGNIGRGAVRNFLSQDYTVVTVCRSKDKIGELIQSIGGGPYGDKLEVLHGDPSSPEDAKAIAQVLKEKYRRVDAVVSSMGPWLIAKPLHEIDHAYWRSSSVALFESHFTIYNAVMPFMLSDENESKENRSYTIVTGAAAEEIVHFTALWAANLRNFSALARFETSKIDTVRVQEMYLHFRVEDDVDYNKKAKGPSEHYMANTEFGRIFTAMASSKAAELKSKVLALHSRTEWQAAIDKYA